MTHPAAELLRAIADGKQMKREFDVGWRNCTPAEGLFLITSGRADEVSIARPMVTREVTYPEPLRVKPERGSKYWTVTSSYAEAQSITWSDHPVDNRIFYAGMAFATEADAAEAHKALFGGQT